jgi:hypothetical protein
MRETQSFLHTFKRYGPSGDRPNCPRPRCFCGTWPLASPDPSYGMDAVLVCLRTKLSPSQSVPDSPALTPASVPANGFTSALCWLRQADLFLAGFHTYNRIRRNNKLAFLSRRNSVLADPRHSDSELPGFAFSSRTIARKCLILVPTMSRELRRFCVPIATSGPCFVSLEM